MNKITERKNKSAGKPDDLKIMDEELLDRDKIFRELMEYIPGVSIQGYLCDGTVIFWNKASEEVYGYTTREALGKKLEDLIIPPDLKPLFRKALEEGKKAGRSGEFLPPGELMLLHKDGHPVPVYSIHTAVCVKEGEPLLFCIDVDLSERKKSEEIITRLNRCFLSLGADSRKNIQLLVEAAGEILGGSCLLYNRYEKERALLCTWGIWQEPEGYKAEDKPEGHICYDVIRGKGEDPVIIEDLTGTRYEKTDPNVIKYGLKSYLGSPVRLKGSVVGSFCLCDVKPRKFTGEEIKVIGMLARAVAIEEERLWIHQAIERAKKAWELTFDTIPDLIMLVDNQYRITRANRATADKLGIPITEIAGQVCYRVVHQMDKPPDFCPLAELRKDGREHSTKAYLDLLEGDYMITTTPIPDREGNSIGAVHVAHDITGLKKIEKELRESEERMELAISGAKLGLWDQDLETGEIIRNRQWFKMLGYTMEGIDPDHMAWQDLLHPDDFISTLKKLNDHLAGKTTFFEAEYRMRTKTGGWKWIQSAGKVSQWDDAGKPLRMLGTQRDITERKQADEELEKYRNNLEELVKDRTAELQSLVNAMAGREARMSDLKDVIKLLREQIKEAGMEPVADDPLLGEKKVDG